MIFLKNYFVSTTKEIDFIPIIHDIRSCLQDSQIKEGLVTIHLPENGASFWLTTNSPAESLRKIWEEEKPFAFPSLSLPFQKKELVLGPKQRIYLVDTRTTPKRREFYVQVLGEGEPQGTSRSPQRPQQGGRQR